MGFTVKIILLIGGVLFIVGDAISLSHYQQEHETEEEQQVPSFLTIGQKYSIAVGSTVVLPCKINETAERSSHLVLVWKNDKSVLTAGNLKVALNPRIRLVPPHENIDNKGDQPSTSYNLEIRDVRVTDAGAYECQIGTYIPKGIVHHLDILVPPKINFFSPATRIDVEKGSTIHLQCRASGNPTPTIIWTRKNNLMPNGDANKTGASLEILHADRRNMGHYQCTADNRVGQPDTRGVFVNVQYPPEIEVNDPFIHTGNGFEAQLTCVVHAEPAPNVVWFKDSTQLGTTEQHSQQNRGNRHTLIIRNVTNLDLGNYTCQAVNNLGRSRAMVTLTGVPTVCTFDSHPLSNYRDQYNISWEVTSYNPILEYRLYIKKQESMSDVLYNSKYPTNSYYGRTSEWENIVIQQDHHHMNRMGHHDFDLHHNLLTMDHNHLNYNEQRRHTHRGWYLLKNLQPATNYEAKVQARNDHGWNKLSQIFKFSTRAEDWDSEPSAQPAVSKTAGVRDKDTAQFNGISSYNMPNLVMQIAIISVYVLCSMLTL